jgi:hypothetical protein
MTAMPIKDVLLRLELIWSRLRSLSDEDQATRDYAVHDMAVNVKSDMLFLLDLSTLLLKEKIDKRYFDERN